MSHLYANEDSLEHGSGLWALKKKKKNKEKNGRRKKETGEKTPLQS